jgi:V/A-type H+-transporting ATPase subunit D
MPLRAPPGRAGRIWLLRRLEVAHRGLDVLDQKRQALLHEQQRLAESLAGSSSAWELAAREAAAWNDRATVLAGERRLRLAAGRVARPCEVEVEWRNALGTVFPAVTAVHAGAAADLVALGGGSAVALSARAHADAVAAGAAYAAARAAYDAVRAELVATTRRQRAIERRWIPEHEAALHRLGLALDEQEREEVARARWAAERTVVRGRPVRLR